MFFEKSPCRKLFQKKTGGKSMAVFPRLVYVLSSFQVFLSDESSKATKNVLQTNRVEKVLQKNRQKKSKTDCFSIFCYHVFGRFSVRGDQKYDYLEKN
jgi:hypothetical protein